MLVASDKMAADAWFTDLHCWDKDWKFIVNFSIAHQKHTLRWDCDGIVMPGKSPFRAPSAVYYGGKPLCGKALLWPVFCRPSLALRYDWQAAWYWQCVHAIFPNCAQAERLSLRALEIINKSSFRFCDVRHVFACFVPPSLAFTRTILKKRYNIWPMVQLPPSACLILQLVANCVDV